MSIRPIEMQVMASKATEYAGALGSEPHRQLAAAHSVASNAKKMAEAETREVHTKKEAQTVYNKAGRIRDDDGRREGRKGGGRSGGENGGGDGGGSDINNESSARDGDGNVGTGSVGENAANAEQNNEAHSNKTGYTPVSHIDIRL